MRGGGSISSAARIARWASVGWVVCSTAPAAPSRVTRCSRCSSVAIRRQLWPLLRSARHRIRAHVVVCWLALLLILLEAVEDGPQLERRLQVAEGALGLAQVLVVERDLLGGEVGVGGGEQVLAVQALLGRHLAAVEQEPAALRLAQVARERRVVAQGALGARVRLSRFACLRLAPGGLDPFELGLPSRIRSPAIQ